MSSSNETEIEGYFVTGTDTEVGKTVIARDLMRRLKEQGHTVLGMKPIASGAIQTKEGLRNEDALALQAECSIDVPYDWINPYCFEPSIAPHIAAEQAGESIRMDIIQYAYSQLVEAGATAIVVEGAGGWLVPINDMEMMSDIADQLNLDVVLVVGLKLGCINHALLTANHLQALPSGYMGWVANHLSPDMLAVAENMRSLSERIGEPMMVHAYDESMV